ncbi:MAG: hypothetical protein H7A25_18550 [Leptospiraceae bacterium]|nr:hypothetical protein [Leptospiraceae bacterium]MCP5501908.1 hypothetical protein [Leptospiraceae bacterium]
MSKIIIKCKNRKEAEELGFDLSSVANLFSTGANTYQSGGTSGLLNLASFGLDALMPGAGQIARTGLSLVNSQQQPVNRQPPIDTSNIIKDKLSSILNKKPSLNFTPQKTSLSIPRIQLPPRPSARSSSYIPRNIGALTANPVSLKTKSNDNNYLIYAIAGGVVIAVFMMKSSSRKRR